MTEIIQAQAADTDPLAAVIAEAFHDLPPSRWLISDQASRRKIFPCYFRILIEHALAHGVVHTTRQRTAAALWLPVSGEPLPDPSEYLLRLASVTLPWAGQFLSFDDTLDKHHPVSTPHHHLAILAVHPGHQGSGAGTALLNTYHRELDQAGQPSYLEASSERSRDLYLRHCYALLPSAPFYLPDCGPPFWPMWREPLRGKEPAERKHTDTAGSARRKSLQDRCSS